MPANITLKNIPDAVYERLKAAAIANRRSLNSEAIVCLEAALLPQTPSATERLAAIRTVRAALGVQTFSAADIDAFKNEGRK